MKISVMQPYIFPYIGYFQMVKAVDKFIFYDDVQFIKNGWINRNKILVNRKDFLFTIPLEKQSHSTLIKNTLISMNRYERWKNNFLKTFEQNYKKAPYFDSVSELVTTILSTEFKSMGELAIASVISVSQYLGLTAEFIISSEKYQNQEMERAERLINICKEERATEYINAIGGMELYSKADFEKFGVKLNFIKSQPIEYKQFNNEFVPWLSIIDVLMFNSIEESNKIVQSYVLI